MNKPSIRDMFLDAPVGQIDEPLMDVIKKWDNEPTAVQVLEAIDNAIFCASTSEFVVTVMQMFYEAKPEDEKKKAVAFAENNWRVRNSV